MLLYLNILQQNDKHENNNSDYSKYPYSYSLE